MIELGVNVDHVATVRQARRTYEPDPVWAAIEAHLGGADGITVHLREDRRHIQDEDVRRLRELTHIKLNLEMAATDEMVAFAARIRPEMAMLVPEGRHEITTEGGLDIRSQEQKLNRAVGQLSAAGIVVSVFIDADTQQVEAAHRFGAGVRHLPFASAAAAQGIAAGKPLCHARNAAALRRGRRAPAGNGRLLPAARGRRRWAHHRRGVLGGTSVGQLAHALRAH
jgi:pyridoxine 5-phosphate synthase